MLQFLRASDRSPPADTGAATHGSGAVAQIADSIIGIGLLLDRLHANRSPLTVTIGTADFSSIILEVVYSGRYFVMDELMPSEGQALLADNPRVQIRGRVDGIEMRFSSTVTASGREDGSAFHKVPFPARLEHTQKRRYFRALVPIDMEILVTAQSENRLETHGEIRDISVGGFSARMLYGGTDTLAVGDYFPRCLISLPDNERICAAAEVCFLSRAEATQSMRIGARFLGMSTYDERRVEKLVTALDREANRKQSRA